MVGFVLGSFIFCVLLEHMQNMVFGNLVRNFYFTCLLFKARSLAEINGPWLNSLSLILPKKQTSS